LCYLDYDPDAPIYPQVQAIAATLLTLVTYQELLTTRTDLFPIKLKWFLGQKSFTYSSQLQHSIAQKPALLQADAYLWYEPVVTEKTSLVGNSDKLVLATGVKGYLDVELQVQAAHTPLHSSYGAIVPNAAWRLLWALNSLKDQHEEILIDGFYDTLSPLEDEAFQLLADLPDTAATQAAHWGIPNMLAGLQGKQMHYAHILTPTCTVTMLHSGEEAPTPAPTTSSHFSIPAKARATVDFCLVPGQDPADIFDKLKSHLRTHGFSDIHVRQRDAGSPAYTPASNAFVQYVRQSAEHVYGQPPIVLPILPEYVPIWPFAQNPSRPVIILPLHASPVPPHPNEQEALRNYATYLLSIIFRLGKGL
jgi:hypothetical protein